MTRKRGTAAFLSVMLLMAMLTGCNKEQGETSEDTRNTLSAETNQTTVPNVTDVIVEPETPEIMAVRTQYGSLYYQEQWAEYMRTEVTCGAKVTEIAFIAEINEKTYPLFVVSIGEADSTFVGQITDSAGKKWDVYVQVEELGQYPELTEGEQNRLYAMQEEINYIIDNLK